MKLKKIVAAAAVFVCACALTLNVSAEEACNAVIGASDSLFSVQDFKTSVKVTGDGKYTIETNSMAGAEDIGVLTVTIENLAKEHPDASAVLNKIEIDGKSVPFTAKNVLYGDLDNNGSYKIAIIDQYSDYGGDPAVSQATRIKKSLKLTFTVSGYERAVPASGTIKPEASQDKQNVNNKQPAPAKPAAQDKQDAPDENDPPVPDKTLPAAGGQTPEVKPPEPENVEASAPMFASEEPIGDIEDTGLLPEIVIFAFIIVIAYKKETRFLPFSPKNH